MAPIDSFISMIVLIIVFALAAYIYTALCLRQIAIKLNYPNPWLAWIPIANNVLMLQLGDFHWAFIFLLLIPFVGWLALSIISIVALWRICEKLNFPGWMSLFSLLGGIALIIILSILAWSERRTREKTKKRLK